MAGAEHIFTSAFFCPVPTPIPTLLYVGSCASGMNPWIVILTETVGRKDKSIPRPILIRDNHTLMVSI